MAIAFNQTAGGAKKSDVKYYEYKNGDNKVRLVGGILPRYMYWVRTANGKNVPFECLAFNRETETFDNSEVDNVQNLFPDLKCAWSYAVLCLDEGEVKVLSLKKKLFQQIMTASEDLGDPTDPDTGFSIFFKKVKTGPHAYNVEYQLQVLKCKPEALTDEEKELVANSKTIDEFLPRETADAQLKRLVKIQEGLSSEEEDSPNSDEFAADLPF